jgi:hypothetical protein
MKTNELMPFEVHDMDMYLGGHASLISHSSTLPDRALGQNMGGLSSLTLLRFRRLQIFAP